MKITMTLEVNVDNPIAFYDACAQAAEKLQHLGQAALDADDVEPWVGTKQYVYDTEDNGGDRIGTIAVGPFRKPEPGC